MPKKIYIIDDDRNIVESLSIVLTSAGYEVSAQNDEKDMIHNIQKYKPGLVILDVMFPENESLGFELARQLKSDAQTKDIPILMLSAINEKGVYPGRFTNRDRDENWLPVHEFVEKPINPKDLIEKVETLYSQE